MEIKIENYRLIPNDISVTKWDLHEYVVRKNKATSEDYDGDKIHGYAMTLQRCIDIIAQLKMIDKCDILSLKEYVSEYKNTVNEVMNLVNTASDGNKNK